jgi:hypothetical protein
MVAKTEAERKDGIADYSYAGVSRTICERDRTVYKEGVSRYVASSILYLFAFVLVFASCF